MKKICLFLVLFLLLVINPVQAVNISSGVAQYVLVAGETLNGSVICASDTGNRLCERDSDPNMVGVVTLNPAVSFQAEVPQEGTVPIVDSGKAYVLVSGQNGEIKAGDFITSSGKNGVATKAIKSGYVLGTAVESWQPNNSDDQTSLLVSVAIKPAVLSTSASNNLVELIRQGLESAFLTPLTAFRYMVAGMILIISVVYGLSHFGKLAKSGVEAVGRNPMASKAIQLSVLMNVVLTVGIILVGVIVAYLTLVL